MSDFAHRGAVLRCALGAIVFLLALSACGAGSDDADAGPSNGDDQAATDSLADDTDGDGDSDEGTGVDGNDDSADDTDGAADADDAADPPEVRSDPGPDVPVDEIIGQIDEFWGAAFAQLDAPYDYETVQPERRVGLTSQASDPPSCNDEQPTYDDGLIENAYVADCDEGLIVVWDHEQLIPGLYERFGSVGVAMLFAHEWGHVIQFQLEIDAPTIVTEQQADCYSGAWLADAQQNNVSYARAADLDAAIGATLEVSDAVGEEASDDAHGLGFDRIRAVQEGFDRGLTYCAGYIDSPPTVTQAPFLREEIATGGNIEFDDLVPAEQDGLNLFFGDRIDEFTDFEAVASETLGASGCEQPSGLSSTCLADRRIEYDRDRVAALHERIGDGSTTILLALAWARATDDGAEGRDAVGRFLFNACRSGAYLANEDGELTASPGDLDEAVRAFVELANETSDRVLADEGALFEAVAALRLGVTQGYDACG